MHLLMLCTFVHSGPLLAPAPAKFTLLPCAHLVTPVPAHYCITPSLQPSVPTSGAALKSALPHDTPTRSARTGGESLMLLSGV